MKHFIMSFAIISLFTSNLVMAKTNFSVEKPQVAVVEVVVFTGLNKLWVKIHDKKKYNKISSFSPFKYKKPKHTSFLIEIYGIQERKLGDVKDKEKDKQYKAMINISNLLKKETVSINCFGRNKKMGIPVCQLVLGNVDVAFNIISAGYSPFRSNSVQNTSLSEIYKDELEKAKANGVGIWEPYYGMFTQHDFK